MWRTVDRQDVDEEAGRWGHAARSVFAQFGGVAAAHQRRRLLHVDVRYVHLRQRVIVTVERPLNPSIKINNHTMSQLEGRCIGQTEQVSTENDRLTFWKWPEKDVKYGETNGRND